MRASQWLETYLKRQSDLAGTRERISKRRSSVMVSVSSAAVPLGRAEEGLHKQR